LDEPPTSLLRRPLLGKDQVDRVPWDSRVMVRLGDQADRGEAPNVGDPFTRSLDRLEAQPIRDDELTALAVRFSYVLPDPLLLSVLRGLAPLVEIGAGTGYWAHRLRQMKTDIIAIDQSPPGGLCTNRYHPDAPSWTTVVEGDQTMLAAHSDRTLFVCWPPLFSSLGDCLTFYAGDAVAWLGDTGVRTAQPAGLSEQFRQVAVYPARALEPSRNDPATLRIWCRRGHRAPRSPTE